MGKQNFPIPTLTGVKLINKLKEHVKNKTAIALTRFGDGETVCIRGYLGYEPRRISSKARKRKTLISMAFATGFGFSEQAISELFSLMVKAYVESEIIGIVNPVNDGNRGYKGLTFEHLEKIGVDVNEKFLCDCRDHIETLGHIETIRDIAQGNPVHILTSKAKWLKERKIEIKMGAPVSFTDVPAKTTGTAQFSHDFYDFRKKLIPNLYKIKEPLVLLGVGAAGKDIGPILKNKYGKICIDMGSVLDAWAGFNTRKSFRTTHKDLGI